MKIHPRIRTWLEALQAWSASELAAELDRVDARLARRA